MKSWRVRNAPNFIIILILAWISGRRRASDLWRPTPMRSKGHWNRAGTARHWSSNRGPIAKSHTSSRWIHRFFQGSDLATGESLRSITFSLSSDPNLPVWPMKSIEESPDIGERIVSLRVRRPLMNHQYVLLYEPD